MQIGKAARSNGSHIKSRLKMEPHGVFKEVTKQCTNKDHYQPRTPVFEEYPHASALRAVPNAVVTSGFPPELVSTPFSGQASRAGINTYLWRGRTVLPVFNLRNQSKPDGWTGRRPVRVGGFRWN